MGEEPRNGLVIRKRPHKRATYYAFETSDAKLQAVSKSGKLSGKRVFGVLVSEATEEKYNEVEDNSYDLERFFDSLPPNDIVGIFNAKTQRQKLVVTVFMMQLIIITSTSLISHLAEI